MQAPSKSRAVAAPAQESASLLVPTLAAVVGTVSLLILFGPSLLQAQVKVAPGTAPATKPAAHAPAPTTTGSAHGALAAQTADKHDAAPKEAPKALQKGTKAPARAVAATPEASHAKPEAKVEHASEEHATVVVAEAKSADATVMAYDEWVNPGGSKIWGSDASTLRGARDGEATTVFLGHAFDPVETEEAVLAVLPPKKLRPRSSEYASAPYTVSAANLLNAGTVGRRSGTAPGSFRGIERLMLLDEVEIKLPTNVPPVVGARLVSVDESPLELGAKSNAKAAVKVASPTGVLEIVKVEPGRPVVARVVQQTGRVEEGQKLLALEGAPVGADVTVSPVARVSTVAPETQVTWVSGDALLPSVQSFIMLGAGEAEGVMAGDQFALVKRRGLGADAPEQRVALVRVVRVTAFGSTAIVIRQDQPGIAVGGAARLVGRAQ